MSNTKQYANYADLITFTRASTGTYLDSDGLLKTATTNTPRIEYDANGNRKGLLIEEARTNLAPFSEDISNAGWDKNRCTVALGGVGPDGAASLYTATATETNSNGMSVQDSVTISSGATTTSSGYARKGTNDWVLIIAFDGSSNGVRQWFNLATGAVGSSNTFGTGFSKVSASITEQGSGLYRWSLTAATTGTNFRVAVFPSVPADLDFDCTIGDVGYVGFVQIEAGSFPTSYISTAGAAASRSADVASIPTSAFGYNPDKGTVVCEFEYQFDTTGGFPRPWEIGSTSTAINRINMFTSGSTGNFVASARSNDVGVTSLTLLSAPPSPVGGKAAFTFAEDDFAACIDGGSVQTDTDGTMVPSVPRNGLTVGGATTATNQNISGHIKSIQYYPRRLSNAQLQRLTA